MGIFKTLLQSYAVDNCILLVFCWISMATYQHGSYADYLYSSQEGVRPRATAPHSPEQEMNAHIKLVELLIRLQKGG